MDAVNERVLIYVHKEEELDKVERLYPADHYVMLDDKLRILTAMKKVWGERLTTIFVKQGHYAHEPDLADKYPAADLEIEHIGDLPNLDLSQIIAAARKA